MLPCYLKYLVNTGDVNIVLDLNRISTWDILVIKINLLLAHITTIKMANLISRDMVIGINRS